MMGRRILAGLGAAAVAVAASMGAPAAAAGAVPADKLVTEGRSLYDAGDYGKALLKFEEATKLGAADGEMFYQMGFCYKEVREDIENSKAYMQKALPLLEARLKAPSTRDLKTYYYAATISLGDVQDTQKLGQISREAISQVQAGAIPKPSTGEGHFQLGRLYGFAGNREEAAKQYEAAARLLEKDASPAGRRLYAQSLQLAGQAAVEKQDWAKAAELFEQLLDADPSRQEMLLPLGLGLFKSGQEARAAEVWQRGTDARTAGERQYLVRIARHWIELGKPKEAAPASDDDLRAAIVEAAKKYAELRAPEDKVAAEMSDKWIQEQQEALKARSKKPAKAAPPAEPAPEIPPDQMTVEQQMAAMGIRDVIQGSPPTPPPSPERVAAEKRFFALLAELVRRGQPVREFTLTNGLAQIVYK